MKYPDVHSLHGLVVTIQINKDSRYQRVEDKIVYVIQVLARLYNIRLQLWIYIFISKAGNTTLYILSFPQ